MADPRGFVSFDIDHNENEKNLFIGQAKNKHLSVLKIGLPNQLCLKVSGKRS